MRRIDIISLLVVAPFLLLAGLTVPLLELTAWCIGYMVEVVARVMEDL